MTIEQRIRQIRENNGIGLAEAAKEAGLMRQRLWQIEQDTSDNPSIKTIAQVAKGIHCTTNDIIHGTIYDNGAPASSGSGLPCVNSDKCPFFKEK
jgi:DNA-binding XRE family transcriptional regulator